MSHRNLLPIASCALIACGLAATSGAQISRAGNAYVFRVKFAAGATTKYKMVVSTTLSGKMGSFSMPMQQSVVGVHHDVGDLVVKTGPLSFNGKAIGAVAVSRMSVNRHGKLVSGDETANSGITVFPEKPVHTGDKWTASVPIPTAGLSGASALVSTTYRFVGMTTYKNQRVAQLALTFSKPGGSFAMKGVGTALVSAKDGNMFHSTMKISVTVSKDMDPVSVNVEVARI